MTDTDYRAIDIPDTKPREEYSWRERRAELLQMLDNVVDPRQLNQTQLAERYDVSQSQISQDFDTLDEFVSDINATAADAYAERTFRKAVQELLSEGKYEAATRVVARRNEFLYNRGKLDKEPDKLDADVTHGGAVGSFDIPEENVESIEAMIEAADDSISDTEVDE